MPVLFSALKSLPTQSEEQISLPQDVQTVPTPIVPPVQERFGAKKIPIQKDPDSSVVTILERPNATNHSDYVVYIISNIPGDSTYYAELITLLRTLTLNSKVDIYISSPGGSLQTGAMVAAAIRKSQARVTTIAVGIVASAAALIWSYGHNRSVSDGSVLMFHMSSHFSYGNSKEIQIKAENLVRYVNEIAIVPLVEMQILTAEEAETIVDKRRDIWIDSTTINSRLEAARDTPF